MLNLTGSSGRSDFLYKDDFDAIMTVTDADMLHNSEKLNLEISSCIKNMTSMKKSSFKREFCDKICLSSVVA